MIGFMVLKDYVVCRVGWESVESEVGGFWYECKCNSWLLICDVI